MNLLEADSTLRKIGYPCITTREVATYLDVKTSYASNILRRLEVAGRTVCLGRGRWLLERTVDPFVIVECLTSPFPAYISLYSALHHHGMISQIPSVVYAASLARTKRYQTAVGVFSVHHLPPRLFGGFESLGRSLIKIATPEKAIIDTLYLSLGRSPYFRALPEIELPKKFQRKRALEFIERIGSRAKQSAVRKRFERLLKECG